MNLEERLLWWQRWTVIVAVIGGSTAVRLGEGDIFGVSPPEAIGQAFQNYGGQGGDRCLVG